jgi:hypothetical protein
VGIWSGVSAVASPSGPLLGGVIASVSWRWIFVLNLPIGVLAVIAGMLLLPRVSQPVGSQLPDTVSVGSLLAAVALLVLATVQGPVWGWDDGRVVALFVAATLAAALTVQRALRAPVPVIEKCLFESLRFSAASVAALIYFAGSAVFVLGSVLYKLRGGFRRCRLAWKWPRPPWPPPRWPCARVPSPPALDPRCPRWWHSVDVGGCPLLVSDGR